jgi:hypothetical protein
MPRYAIARRFVRLVRRRRSQPQTEERLDRSIRSRQSSCHLAVKRSFRHALRGSSFILRNRTRRSLILVVVAITLIAATGSVANAAQSCYVNSYGELEINVGSQFGYSDSAVRSAINIAKANGCQVYFQPGTYYYDSPLINDGLRFAGKCSDNVAELSVLSATDANGSAIFLREDSPEILCLKITSPNASVRSGSNSANGVTVDFATNFVVDHVTVDRVAAAGIFNRGGSYGRITSNRVLNSLGDGIHNTRGANHTIIAFNSVLNTGDDFIAVVSYVWQSVESHDITISDNSLETQPQGRGITISGG